jgi:predicted nucleic acid-binding protein
MKQVIDASVAIKWYVEQEHSGLARQLAAGSGVLIAPELLLAEAGNVFWKYVRGGLIAPEKARAALSKLPDRFDMLSPLLPLTEDALEIAVSLNHPVYDCFYLALGRREGAQLVTADKRLAAAAKSLPDADVQLLGG